MYDVGAAVCGDCAEVAVLVRACRWAGPPYCPVHWLLMLGAAGTGSRSLGRLVDAVVTRRRRLRLVGVVGSLGQPAEAG